uniref:Uncharacterized protein n=1 Tax=Anopheles atroparvus TaxID=41427 RepID=A0A182IQF7_ANOAO
MAEESVDAVVLNVNDTGLALAFRNICFRQKDPDGGRPKDIIRSVSGNFQPGRLVAILGPSGAGKSSLLSILSGLKQTGFIGTIEINGSILDRSRYRQQCVFIQQDFSLLEHLTVLETMNYAAELKMPRKSRSEMVRKKKVNDILRVLGLASSMGTLVEKLSGGERKRLSIGIEMVCNPPIVLLDEPTSGLDSVAAMELISYVKTVASEGRTVACVIHQPSSSLFRLFDDLYLLSSGRCIYRGPLDAMVDAFAEAGFHCPKYYNRADFVPLEAKVFVRERLNNWYSLEAYYLSKIVADLPLQILCPSLFLAIAYYLTDQPLEWERFGMLWLVLLLLGIFAQTVGLLSGAAFNMQMATFFVPCFSIPSLLFSGFFVKTYEMNEVLSHIANVSFFRYSLQGSLQAVYGNNRTTFPCSQDVCYYNKPKKFLKFMDTSEDGYWDNVYALLGFVLVFQVILYVVLRLRLKIYH